MSRYKIDGNTARRENESQQKKNKKKVSVRNQKKQKPKLNRKFVYSVLAGCIMVTMASTHYLQLKSEMAIQKKRLTSQKLEYSELKADNDAYYSEVLSSVDLETIRKKALDEFGMKHATEDQIKYYTPDGDGYVRQYQEVPEE